LFVNPAFINALDCALNTIITPFQELVAGIEDEHVPQINLTVIEGQCLINNAAQFGQVVVLFAVDSIINFVEEIVNITSSDLAVIGAIRDNVGHPSLTFPSAAHAKRYRETIRGQTIRVSSSRAGSKKRVAATAVSLSNYPATLTEAGQIIDVTLDVASAQYTRSNGGMTMLAANVINISNASTAIDYIVSVFSSPFVISVGYAASGVLALANVTWSWTLLITSTSFEFDKIQYVSHRLVFYCAHRIS
jgi:hypothetical protein